MAQYPDPESRNVLEPGCSRCPALAESRECISWGNGSIDADVVVVGEAPAFGVAPDSTDSASGDQPRVGDPDAETWRGGNWTGMAYTSRHSGRKVRDLFADAGLAPNQLYFTNAVKCFPAAKGGGDGERGAESEDGDEIEPSNREPTSEERANCRPHLVAEIEAVEPAVVATTGKHATLAVLDDRELADGFLDSVLEPVEFPAFETTVLPLLHPSYQNVWLPRIGYSREEYVAAITDMVERLR